MPGNYIKIYAIINKIPGIVYHRTPQKNNNKQQNNNNKQQKN